MRRLLPALLLLAMCACTPRWHEQEGAVWSTAWQMRYSAPRLIPADSIRAAFHVVDTSLSAFHAGSLVARINAVDSAVAVDDTFRYIFTLSQRVCSLSNGAFDPTVGPLVDAWGFGTERHQRTPSDTLIARLLPTVGLRGCLIDTLGRLHKKSPGTRFNLSAVAKGYGVDLLAALLERHGATNYMVEIGGEVRVKGTSPTGQPWRIMVESPLTGDDTPAIVELTDGAIATSGNYRNRRPGAWHTISPVTGHPVLSPTLSATVIAPTCALADALATAAMAMPPDSALATLNALPDVRALLCLARGDTLRTLTTQSW